MTSDYFGDLVPRGRGRADVGALPDMVDAVDDLRPEQMPWLKPEDALAIRTVRLAIKRQAHQRVRPLTDLLTRTSREGAANDLSSVPEPDAHRDEQ